MNNKDLIYQGILPFDGLVVYPSQEEQRSLAAKRAKEATSPYFDFSKAMDLLSGQAKEYTFRGKLKNPLLKAWIPPNCINTASYWVTGNNTISANKHLFDNPAKYGYTRISKEEAQPGDLTQYYSPSSKKPYHAGIILDNNEYRTIIKSSDGFNKLNPIRYYDSEGLDMDDPKYNDNIKNNLYYRYTYPYSGVYFEQNGKLIQEKRQGGILGIKHNYTSKTDSEILHHDYKTAEAARKRFIKARIPASKKTYAFSTPI